MRLLYAIFVKHNLLPSQYAALPFVERAFVRQSVLEELSEEAAIVDAQAAAARNRRK